MACISLAVHEILYSSDDEDDYRGPKEYRPRINFEVDNAFAFKEKFRISSSDTEYLLEKIGPNLRHKTSKNFALSPDQQLLIALHWLGNGCQYHGTADMHGVVKSTVCRSVHTVLGTIADKLFQDVVRFPSNCENLALEFLQLGGFPNVCGCVDGTLFNIDAPRQNESHFVDRYGNHSLNTLMICGPDMTFFCVNPNWPGATHDARVLRNTITCQRFDNGWRPFPGAVVLGDSGYGLSDWLIPPLFNNPQNQAERRFNRHHKKTRRLIECAYGILKERFPCLNYMRLQPQMAGLVIIVCAILHNIARKDDFPFDMPDVEDDLPEPNVNYEPNQRARVERLLQYFM